MSDNKACCFAIRRLSPFQGFTQILDAGTSQASSHNGIDWRIQATIKTDAETQDILFGFWSSEGGFHRVPLPPLVSSEQVEVAAQPVLDELLATTRQVPYESIDHHELWLLDANEKLPLALIASASDPSTLSQPANPTWESTVVSDHSFTRTWSKQSSQTEHTDRDELNQLINHAAGEPAAAQWFLREPDGSGKGLDGINLVENLSGRSLAKSTFPELLLREEWQDEHTSNLVASYLNWQAPFLLTLPNLNPMTRKRLEQEAFKQPFKVEGQHKLWPEVIDNERLKATLVEAQMRRSNPEAGNQ